MTVWRGVEDLRPFLVPLSSVSPHPDNPKDHDLGAIAASLARFGQQVPILVQKSTGWIVAGNGRWAAVPMVGELEKTLEVGPGEDWTHVAAVFTDLGDLEAKAYALADNRTHDLGGYHEELLAKLLVELGPGGLVGTGYDPDDVDAILASLSPMIPEGGGPPPAEPELRSEVVVEIRCARAFLEAEHDFASRDGYGTTTLEILESWQQRDGVEVSIA